MDLDITADQHNLLTLCALRVGDSHLDWSLLARNAQSPEGLAALLDGQLREDSRAATKNRPLLHQALTDGLEDARARVDDEVAAAGKAGARLVTVLDADYPANLRVIGNLPPFLFYRGELDERDARSIAVVGTRQASEDGLRRAARMARELIEHDVVIASGLAKGSTPPPTRPPSLLEAGPSPSWAPASPPPSTRRRTDRSQTRSWTRAELF